jgi:4-alpha-glucanotransferase
LADQQKQNVSAYLGRSSLDSGEVTAALIQLAWSSVAALAIAPLQDLLNLGSGAEINVPGNPEGNWRWRCTEEMLATLDVQRLRELTLKSNRHLN